jgi:hypothetical protein
MRLDALFATVFHAHMPIRAELFPAAFNTAWPAIGFFIPSLLWSLIYAALAGLAILVVRLGWQLRAWWLWAAIGLVLVSLGPSQAHSLAAYAVGWVASFLPLLVAVGVAGLFLRDNILAYVAVLLCTQSAGPLLESFSQPHEFFRWNGVALGVLIAATLIWMMRAPGRAEGTATGPGSPPAAPGRALGTTP